MDFGRGFSIPEPAGRGNPLKTEAESIGATGKASALGTVSGISTLGCGSGEATWAAPARGSAAVGCESGDVAVMAALGLLPKANHPPAASKRTAATPSQLRDFEDWDPLATLTSLVSVDTPLVAVDESLSALDTSLRCVDDALTAGADSLGPEEDTMASLADTFDSGIDARGMPSDVR